MATGLYPHQHGVVGNDPEFSFEEVERFSKEWMNERASIEKSIVDAFEKLPNLPDILGELGYLPLQTGKWWEGYYSRGGFTSGMATGDPICFGGKAILNPGWIP